MFRYFAQDTDMESVMLDSTIVRAHACAAGAIAQQWAEAERQRANSVQVRQDQAHPH
jgi:hypothetical protein